MELSTVYGEIGPTGGDILVTVLADDIGLSQAAGVLRSLTAAVTPTQDPNTYSVPLTWTTVTQLAHDFKGTVSWDGRPGLRWVPGPALSDWMIAEIIRRSCEGDFAGERPVREPMRHQLAGAVAIGMNGSFLLADDMGTGKGGTYLMGLAELDARGRRPWPALMVTPAGVIDTLLEEIAQWYPGWKAAAYRGTGRQRLLKSDARILVMGYETMRNDTGTDKKTGSLTWKFQPGAVVYDETHALCNFGSLQSRAARRLAKHAPSVLAGSGTPITKNAAGFWPVLNAMYPRSYPSRERFKARYFVTRRNAAYGSGDADIAGLDPLREPEFRVTMQGVYRRVALEDVVDMPPKSYQVRYVEVPPAWRAAYDQMEADMLAELPDQMTPLEANVAVVKMMRLRQLACSACDVKVTRETEQNPHSPRYGEEVEHTEVTLKEPCWKGKALVDLLDEMHQGEGVHDELGRRRGHTRGSRPVLAFAEFSQLTRLAGQMAEKAGYAVGYIDGDVKPADRNEVRHAFQGNQLDLLCVTTGTGGVGLNLTAARDVAFLARPFAFVPAVQSERRAWRRGQDQPVTVYDFFAKNTVESRIFAKLKDKALNLSDLVQDRRIAEEFLGGTRH